MNPGPPSMPTRCKPRRSRWWCRSTASCAAISRWPSAPTRARCGPRRSPTRTCRSSSARTRCAKSSSCRVSSSTSWCNCAMVIENCRRGASQTHDNRRACREMRCVGGRLGGASRRLGCVGCGPGRVGRGLGTVAALSAALALAACGFRLAGSDPLPGVLARPYLSLKDPYTDFSREFEHQLKNSGATPQTVRANATAIIDVTKDLVEQRTLSVSAQNIPTEYELIYTVTFTVQGTDKELLAPQTISLSRDYSFEENVLLAKEHEADILRQQMARDLVSIAMRRLTSLK